MRVLFLEAKTLLEWQRDGMGQGMLPHPRPSKQSFSPPPTPLKERQDEVRKSPLGGVFPILVPNPIIIFIINNILTIQFYHELNDLTKETKFKQINIENNIKIYDKFQNTRWFFKGVYNFSLNIYQYGKRIHGEKYHH